MNIFHIHEYKPNILYIRYIHTTGTNNDDLDHV